MTGIIIEKLVWDEWNIEHIKKHKDSVVEVEESIFHLIAHKHSYKGRYILIGRSGKRLISIIVKRQAVKTYYVVTARDADRKERNIVYEKEK